MEKAIIFQGGQNYGHKYWSTFLDLIKRGKQHPCPVVPTSYPTHCRRIREAFWHLCCVLGEIDPSFIITHRLPLEKGPEAYKMSDEKKASCTCQLHFITSNVTGDITIVKLSACTQKIAICQSCCAGWLHQGGIEAACHLCRRLTLCCAFCWWKM